MSVSNTTKRDKDIRRNTRRKLSSEEKIRVVPDGLRGENSIAELCRREGINSNLYYRVRRQSIWHRLSYYLRDTFLPVLSPV